jgi:hypothetical protein
MRYLDIGGYRIGMSLTIDPSIIPWSYRGSYVCLATRAGDGGSLTPSNDIYLVSHNYGFGLPLFALRHTINEPFPPPSGFHTSPSPTTYDAEPSELRWKLGEEVVARATFQDARILRLKGSKPLSFDTQGDLKVDHWRCWMFKVPKEDEASLDTVEFTALPNVALRFVALKGQLELENGAPYGANFKDLSKRITILPVDGEWELAIVERETESRGGSIPEGTFEAARNHMAANFNSYAQSMCPLDSTATDQLAAYVMWTSTVRASGFIRKEAVLMSKLWMNKVGHRSLECH